MDLELFSVKLQERREETQYCGETEIVAEARQDGPMHVMRTSERYGLAVRDCYRFACLPVWSLLGVEGNRKGAERKV